MSVLESVPFDTRNVLGAAAQLLVAWRDELIGLLPQSLRLKRRPGLEAEPLPAGGFRLIRGGRQFARGLPSTPTPTAVTLRLPASAVLVSETLVPEASDADIARMLTLDIDRLTPFDQADVFTAISLASRRSGVGGRRALVGAIPKVDLLALIERARAERLEPRSVILRASPEGFPPLDFTQSVGPVLSTGATRRTRLLWLLAAVLAATDLAVLVAQDVARTRELRAEMAVLRPRLLVVQRLRTRVLEEEARRSAILAARKRGDPLRVLDEVSRSLPDGAWVQRLNWDGATVRLSGYRREGVDVMADLRAQPDFEDVRSIASDLGGGAAAGIPFEVSVRVRTRGP